MHAFSNFFKQMARLALPLGRRSDIIPIYAITSKKGRPRDITREKKDGAAVLALEGKLDTLTAQKAVTPQGGRMRVINSNEMVRPVFAITRFDQILTLE